MTKEEAQKKCDEIQGIVGGNYIYDSDIITVTEVKPYTNENGESFSPCVVGKIINPKTSNTLKIINQNDFLLKAKAIN